MKVWASSLFTASCALASLVVPTSAAADSAWRLVAYADQGELNGATLSTASGSLYSSARRGVATSDWAALSRAGYDEVAIGFNLNEEYPTGDPTSYEFAVAFDVNSFAKANSIAKEDSELSGGLVPPVGHSASSFSTSSNSSSQALLPVRVLRWNHSMLPLPASSFYTRASLLVDNGQAYGLVFTSSSDSQLDWTPDAQLFQCIYLGIKTPGVVQSSDHVKHSPNTMAVFMRQSASFGHRSSKMRIKTYQPWKPDFSTNGNMEKAFGALLSAVPKYGALLNAVLQVVWPLWGGSGPSLQDLLTQVLDQVKQMIADAEAQAKIGTVVSTVTGLRSVFSNAMDLANRGLNCPHASGTGATIDDFNTHLFDIHTAMQANAVGLFQQFSGTVQLLEALPTAMLFHVPVVALYYHNAINCSYSANDVATRLDLLQTTVNTYMSLLNAMYGNYVYWRNSQLQPTTTQIVDAYDGQSNTAVTWSNSLSTDMMWMSFKYYATIAKSAMSQQVVDAYLLKRVLPGYENLQLINHPDLPSDSTLRPWTVFGVSDIWRTWNYFVDPVIRGYSQTYGGGQPYAASTPQPPTLSSGVTISAVSVARNTNVIQGWFADHGVNFLSGLRITYSDGTTSGCGNAAAPSNTAPQDVVYLANGGWGEYITAITAHFNFQWVIGLQLSIYNPTTATTRTVALGHLSGDNQLLTVSTSHQLQSLTCATDWAQPMLLSVLTLFRLTPNH